MPKTSLATVAMVFGVAALPDQVQIHINFIYLFIAGQQAAPTIIDAAARRVNCDPIAAYFKPFWSIRLETGLT